MDKRFLKLQLNHSGTASDPSAVTRQGELPGLCDYFYWNLMGSPTDPDVTHWTGELPQSSANPVEIMTRKQATLLHECAALTRAPSEVRIWFPALPVERGVVMVHLSRAHNTRRRLAGCETFHFPCCFCYFECPSSGAAGKRRRSEEWRWCMKKTKEKRLLFPAPSLPVIRTTPAQNLHNICYHLHTKAAR